MTNKITALEQITAERLEKLKLAERELEDARRTLQEKHGTYCVALSQYNLARYAFDKTAEEKEDLDSAEKIDYT